jgi:hypothetical protein
LQVIAGVDIETTGSELRSHRTLQVGIADGAGLYYCYDVGDWSPRVRWSSYGPFFPDDIVPTPEALQVNKWTEARYNASQPHDEVDIILEHMLRAHGLKERSIVAVGWNIAGFDVPFLQRDLPRFAKFLHYRTVDLNACCFMLAGSSREAYLTFKDNLKKQATERLAEAERLHDAGYDAKHGLMCFNILRESYGLPAGK